MTERMILAGWGGQGMMLLGKLLATIMMRQGREVTYFPSYGAEVRGGTAHSQVVYSTEPIYSPAVEQADTLIIMNQPSYDKFHARLAPDGAMLLNSTMVSREQPHPGATIIRIPATNIAIDIGDVRIANVIMLGACRVLRDFAPVEAVQELLRSTLTGRKAALLEANLEALARGERLACEALSAQRARASAR